MASGVACQFTTNFGVVALIQVQVGDVRVVTLVAGPMFMGARASRCALPVAFVVTVCPGYSAQVYVDRIEGLVFLGVAHAHFHAQGWG